MNASMLGLRVIASPYVHVGQILVMDGRIVVRRLEHLRWQLAVWSPLLAGLRHDVSEHLAGLVAEAERRLFGEA